MDKQTFYPKRTCNFPIIFPFTHTHTHTDSSELPCKVLAWPRPRTLPHVDRKSWGLNQVYFFTCKFSFFEEFHLTSVENQTQIVHEQTENPQHLFGPRCILVFLHSPDWWDGSRYIVTCFFCHVDSWTFYIFHTALLWSAFTVACFLICFCRYQPLLGFVWLLGFIFTLHNFPHSTI